MASLPLPVPQWQPNINASTKRSAMVGAVAPARLSALEWSIVAMAERDPLASIRERSRWIATLGSIFGFKRPNRLATEPHDRPMRHHKYQVEQIGRSRVCGVRSCRFFVHSSASLLGSPNHVSPYTLLIHTSYVAAAGQDGTAAAQVASSARRRGWPAVTGEPGTLRKLDTAVQIEELP